MIRCFVRGSVAVLLSVLMPATARGQDTGFEWSNTTELSFVSTSGNASSSTFGLKGTLEGEGGLNEIKFEFGGVRVSSSGTARTAVGTPTDFTLVEVERSETTAESYFARGRYDREFGAGFGFTGAGWDRNTFSGLQNRFQIVAGLGRTFVDGEASRFKADLGLTYTIQKDVDPSPDADEFFGGLRMSLDAMRAVSPNAQVNSELVLNNSFVDVEDLRADWITSLSVSINSGLALKTSVQLLWDNVPALLSVPLESEGGVPTGVEVLAPSSKLDSVVTVTLVIKL